MAIPVKTVSVSREVVLDSGHAVEVDAQQSTLRISNAEGRVELRVRCTDQGCVLEFGSADISLSAPGKLAFDCDEFAVNARRCELRAEELELEATRGDAVLRANDRVRLVGEQLLLNSEQAAERSREQLAAFWKLFGM